MPSKDFLIVYMIWKRLQDLFGPKFIGLSLFSSQWPGKATGETPAAFQMIMDIFGFSPEKTFFFDF